MTDHGTKIAMVYLISGEEFPVSDKSVKLLEFGLAVLQVLVPHLLLQNNMVFFSRKSGLQTVSIALYESLPFE